MFIILILLVIGVIYLFQQQNQRSSVFSEHPQSRDHSRDALDILRERYARGDISEQEFNERKKVLQ